MLERPSRNAGSFARRQWIAALTLAFASSASAASFRIVLDLDNSLATGCMAVTPGGSFAGIEQILTTTVQPTGAASADVTAVSVETCSAGVFGAPVPVNAPVAPPWNVGVGQGDGSTNVIETYLPTSLLPPANSDPQAIRLVVVGIDGGRTADVAGPAVWSLASVIEVPTLGSAQLLLLAVLLVLAAVVVLRRGGAAAIAIVCLLAGATAVWAAITLDGNPADWTVGDRVATDPAEGTTPGADVVSVYAKEDTVSGTPSLAFRIDATLVFNQPPVASPDSATVLEDSGANAIDVLGNDTDAELDAFTIASVTQPLNGTVANNTTDVSYTPNANYCNNPPGTTLDTFTYTLTPGGDTAMVTVTVTCTNDPPAPNGGPFTVAENSPNGTVVGTVLANDPDAGDTHTWAILLGNTGGAFAIDAAGQITVATSAAVDFETNPAFNLTVQATDSGVGNLQGSTTVTINVTNGNEPPAPTGGPFSIAENSANATSVGTVAANDPDAADTHTWLITSGNTGGAFAINAATGEITVANSAALDFETTPSFALTVQATDNGAPNLSGSATVTVNLSDVNDAPVVNPATFPIAENAPNGTSVGTVTATDADVPAQTLTWAITAGNTGGAFAINAATGEITVANSAALDFETTPSFALTVQATDNGAPNLSGTASVTVDVSNANDAPVVNAATFSIDENSANGTAVGTATFTDPDAGQTHTFAITAGNTGGAFAIDPSTGAITVANSAALDFETTPSFALTVQVTDDGTPNLSGTNTVTVNLNNVNEQPVVDAATFSVDEGSANGTPVGTATFTDPDAGQTHTFAIAAGNTGGAFAINPSTGAITVANSAAIDFETTPSFALTVQVTDDGAPNLSGTNTVTVSVNDVNEAPAVDAATFSIDENTANGTAVGTATFTDPDPGQTHTFAITAGNTGGAFAINPGSGAITVANSAALDFETTPSFALTVQVTDDGAPILSGSNTVTVNLNNVNDPPLVTPATFGIAENSASGTSVGTVTFTDQDAGQTHTFAITAGNTGGAFAINAATGEITVANAAALDFETMPSLALTVQVTDNGTPTLSGTATVTVNLTDVNEAPVVNPATFAIDENSPNGTSVGTVTFTDPDAGQTHTFAITAGNTGGAFAINAATGEITVATVAAVDFETNPTFALTVQVTDNGAPNLSGTATITVNLNDLPEPPVTSPESFDDIGNTLLEVAATETATGPHVFATGNVLANDFDPEGSGMTASFVSATGGASVTVNSDGTFTYLPGPGSTGAQTFVYNATNSAGSTPGTVTINLQQMVWYVKNNQAPGGLGRSTDPFDTLVEAQTASAANHWIFVDFGDGTTTGQSAGILLKTGQHLIGEYAGLAIPVSINGGPNPTVIAPVPGATACGGGPCRPFLDDTTVGTPDGVAATDVIPAEIIGLNLAGNVNAIDWTTTGAFAGSGTLAILDNVVRSAGAEGVDISLAGTAATTLAFSLNSLTSTGTGLDIQEIGTGALTIVSFQGNAVNGNTGGSGMVVNNAIFDATPGAPFDTVAGGNTVIGAPANGVGGAGMVLTASGDLAFTDLDIFADNGAAFSLAGSGAVDVGVGSGTRVAVVAAVGIFEATGGPAVSASSATIDLQLSSLRSTNSASAGVSLTNVTDGTTAAVFSAPSGSTITEAAGTDFLISGGNATVTYGGTLTDDLGQLVSVASTTADAKTFSGAISDGGDGDGSGIALTGNNASAVIAFTGPLTLSTGANTAFSATGGGTVTVTDNTNTVNTTSGQSVVINGTNIGAGGVKFRSVGHNGNNTAIDLNATGAGPFSITGAGGAGTGGTLQNIVGADAIRLNGTSGLVTLNDVIIQDITAANDATALEDTHSNVDAIHGQNVNGGLALDNVTIQRISDNGINGSVDGASPAPTVWNGLTLTDCTFTNTNRFNTSHADANNESAVHILGIKGIVSVTGTSFSNAGSGLRLWSDTSGTLDVTIRSNSFTTLYKEVGTLSVGLYGIDIRQFGSLSSIVRIGDTTSESNAALGNTFTNGGDRASIDVIADTGSTGAMKTSIAKNTFTITDHSSPGFPPGNTQYNFPQGGVLLRTRGSGNYEAIFAANVLDQVMHADGGIGQLSIVNEVGDSEVIVRNNTFRLPWDAPIELRADGASGGQNSAKVFFTGNTYVDGTVGDGTTDLGGPSPYEAFYAQVRNGGKMDLTVQNESPFGLTDTSSALGTFSFYARTTTAGDLLNLFLQNTASPRGYQLNAAAGTTYNLYRNGSASGSAQGVLQDNGNTGGGGADGTTPPVTNTPGAGTVTLANAAPALPSITPP